MEELINLLIEENKTISTMESCTGGYLANFITNIPNASKVFSFGAVTYSNEYKIKMGVLKDIIDRYSVYSQEVSKDMSRAISEYTKSSYGIGITGKLKKIDENNLSGEDDLVYYSIYDRENKLWYTDKIHVTYEDREDNKRQIINRIIERMIEIINMDHKTISRR